MTLFQEKSSALPRAPAYNPDVPSRIATSYAAGLSEREIARLYGWSQSAIHRRLVREGVLRRPVTCGNEPRGIRLGSDADRDHPPAGVTQDHQAVEQFELDPAYDEQIQRSDASGMIAQERLP